MLNIISLSMTISSLVAVLRSLYSVKDFKSISLLNQALEKTTKHERIVVSFLRPNLIDWSCPNLVDFNNYLKEKAEAHEQVKIMHEKLKLKEASKTKAVPKVLPRQLQLRKILSIHLVSSARAIISCGKALYLRRKRQHKTLCRKQIVLHLLTRQPRIPAVYSSKEMH